MSFITTEKTEGREGESRERGEMDEEEEEMRILSWMLLQWQFNCRYNLFHCGSLPSFMLISSTWSFSFSCLVARRILSCHWPASAPPPWKDELKDRIEDKTVFEKSTKESFGIDVF